MKPSKIKSATKSGARLRTRSQFVLRRAFALGSVSRADTATAFELSQIQAYRVLQSAVADFPKLLQPGPSRRGVVPVPGSTPPAVARAARIIEDMMQGCGWQVTGVTPEEWNIRLQPYPVAKFDENMLETIIRARRFLAPLEILYGGMRRAEEPRWRTVIPMSLEFTGRQWRLIAIDTEIEGEDGERTFVLPRIAEARLAPGTLIKPAQLKKLRARGSVGVSNREKHFIAELHPHFNRYQREAICRELGIGAHGSILISERQLYEFKRLYQEEPISADIVWPPILRLERGG